jgi:tRNA threonylcarbamoyladenosine biosynthesis protein TsaE
LAESLSVRLADPAATARFGALLAQVLAAAAPDSRVLNFEGELGAGKTAMIRGLLAGLGHQGRVPSPTYTLVEPYLVATYRVYHVDLYRLRDPAELDHLGLVDELGTRDELGRGSLLLTEWPDRGAGRLPPPDLACHLVIDGAGRRAYLTARGGEGLRLLAKVAEGLPVGF